MSLEISLNLHISTLSQKTLYARFKIILSIQLKNVKGNLTEILGMF
jgi:hypothetical protein